MIAIIFFVNGEKSKKKKKCNELEMLEVSESKLELLHYQIFSDCRASLRTSCRHVQ